MKQKDIMKLDINSFDPQKLRDFCKREGKKVRYHKGEQIEQEGYPAKWFAFVEKGYFKYVKRDAIDDKEHIFWFSSEGDFLADYPACLYGQPALTTIEAMSSSHVYRVSREQLMMFFRQDMESMELRSVIGEYMLHQLTERYLSFYFSTSLKRYQLLQERYPDILKRTSIKDIASLFNITPKTISLIRHEIIEQHH